MGEQGPHATALVNDARRNESRCAIGSYGPEVCDTEVQTVGSGVWHSGAICPCCSPLNLTADRLFYKSEQPHWFILISHPCESARVGAPTQTRTCLQASHD